MKKFFAYFLIFLFLLTPASSISSMHLLAHPKTSVKSFELNIKPSVGIKSFYVHRWGIRVYETSYLATTTNASLIAISLDQVFKSLDRGRLSIILGKNYPSKKLVYLSPLIMIGKNANLSLSSLFGIQMGGEILFKKGDTIPLALLLYLSNLTSTFLPNITFTSFFGLQGINSTTNISQLLVIPYNYSAESIFPPAPLLDPKNLGLYASTWGAISLFLNGFGGQVLSFDDRVDFYLFGENNSLFVSGDKIIGAVVNAVFSYDRDTGVEVGAYINSTITVRSGGSVELKYHFELALSYMGGEDLPIDLMDGDKLGYRVTNFDYSKSLLDLLSDLQNYGLMPSTTLNLTLLDSALDVIEKVNVTFTFNESATIDGINLVFNTLSEVPEEISSLLNASSSNFTELINSTLMGNTTIFNSLIPGSIYLLGAWEESAGFIQALSLIRRWSNPLFMFSPNTTMSIDVMSDNRFLRYPSSGDPKYYAFVNDFNIRYVQPKITVNDTAIPPVKANINVRVQLIYDSKGYLTRASLLVNTTYLEIEISESVLLVFRNIYLLVEVSGVENRNGEPDFNSVKSSPSLSSSEWLDISLDREDKVIGYVADNSPPEILKTDIESYYNDTGTFFEIKSNISDESPIILARVNLTDLSSGFNASAKMGYNSNENLFVARFFVRAKITDANITVFALDIYHNNVSVTIHFKKPSSSEFNQLLMFVVAIGITAAVIGLIIYVWKKR